MGNCKTRRMLTMKHHSFDFQRARAEASALDSMWNEADPLFEAISRRGEESYTKPDEPIVTLHDKWH